MANNKIIYIDKEGLEYFLGKIKAAYAGNNAHREEFKVGWAEHATKDASGNTISDTYVPLIRTIAGVDLQDDITKAELNEALETVLGINFKGSRETVFTPLRMESDQTINIDLSDYAKFEDIAAALNFKGSKTGDELRALTVSDVKNGDVWSCTADSTDNPITFHQKMEYAAVVTKGTGGAPDVLTWTELGSWVDLSGYVQKTQTVNGHALTGNITLVGSDIQIDTYTLPQTKQDVAVGDTIPEAIAKVEKKFNVLDGEAVKTIDMGDYGTATKTGNTYEITMDIATREEIGEMFESE